VALVDQWDFEIPSTKAAIASLAALGLSGKVLVVLGEEDGYADRSFGNLPDIQTIISGELNAYDILTNDWVVFTDETLPGGSGDPDGSESVATDTAAVPESSDQGADVTVGADPTAEEDGGES
jgi:hypothetical protein